MGKLSKDRRDIYYRKAKEEGYRARSAYKLLQLDLKFALFENVTRVVDLCAAPGSWSQVIRKQLFSRHQRRLAQQKVNDKETEQEPLVVAVDLQEMAPLQGVINIQGDITASSTVQAVLEAFKGELADLVVCDGAPDVTGLHDVDEFIQSQLLVAGLQITTQLLREGGTFVAKVFRGESIPLVYHQLQLLFEDVWCCKPASSRNSSLEAFVVCRNFRRSRKGVPAAEGFEVLSSEDGDGCWKTAATLPFVVCGDLSGYESDRNYPLEDVGYVAAVQPPINAPYDESVREKRSGYVKKFVR